MGMPRGGQDLLTQIERDALDEGVPLAATLRKCIALGAQARNADLVTGPVRSLTVTATAAFPSTGLSTYPS